MLDSSSSGSRGRAWHRRSRGIWLSVIAVAGVLALGVPAASVAAAPAAGAQSAGSAAQTTALYKTAQQYVIRFWPRWISSFQQAAYVHSVGPDQLIGPTHIGPQFRIINAINNDTIYCSSFFVDLRLGPAILTIPATKTVFSVQWFDVFGTTFKTN